uniref:C-type lectin domain-containing protein n=1 Tax=Gadus morhua TaxID=8049 RepID=A0A8C5FAA6_GADMO
MIECQLNPKCEKPSHTHHNRCPLLLMLFMTNQALKRGYVQEHFTFINETPDGWKKFGCKCYKTSDTYLSWNESREFCVSHGADLVVVDSKEEMDFISRSSCIF